MPANGRAYLAMLLCYGAAAAAAAWVVTLPALAGQPLVAAAVADVVATVVVFVFSISLRNSSMYDPYWTVAPPLLLAYFATLHGASSRLWLVAPLVLLWAARLTWNFLRGWRGLSQQDWRYVDMQGKTGRLYWPVSFLGIHLFPTGLTFAGSLTLYVATGAPARPLGGLDLLAALVTVGGILCEATADAQLARFSRSGKPAGTVMDEGLWRYSRHPNYFGEITFWWGLFLFALAADTAGWWTAIGPAAITALFVFISIPMIDRRMRSRRPAYADHATRVSGLVPWFRRSA